MISERTIRAKIKELSDQKDDVDEKTHALQTTLEIFRAIPTFDDLNVSVSELRGLRLADALCLLARRHNWRIESRVVRPALIEAGVLPAEKASTMLFDALSNSECFESKSRGVYVFSTHHRWTTDHHCRTGGLISGFQTERKPAKRSGDHGDDQEPKLAPTHERQSVARWAR